MARDVAFLAEYANGQPTRGALELAAGAADLAGQSGGAAVGLAYGPGAEASGSLGQIGAGRVVVLGSDAAPAVNVAATAAAVLAGGDFAVLLAPATFNGRDLAAALVGLRGLPAFGPVRSLTVNGGSVRCEQSTLQGTSITVSEPGTGAPTPAVVLVAANTFTPREPSGADAPVTTADPVDSPFAQARIVESQPETAAIAALEEADIIVAGGRGTGGEAGFAALRELADVLGGAVGASRAAADAGWVPYQLQIGQTGKVVKPSLYLAAGISGAIQHRVGMQSAEHVVAINRDPDAPIGEFADLFVVGDLFQIVPALTAELRRRKGI